MHPSIERVRHLTYDQAESMHYHGRLSERDWKTFQLLWSWGCGRMSGSAGFNQDIYFRTHGKEAYTRRINRVRRLMGLELYPV